MFTVFPNFLQEYYSQVSPIENAFLVQNIQFFLLEKI